MYAEEIADYLSEYRNAGLPTSMACTTPPPNHSTHTYHNTHYSNAMQNRDFDVQNMYYFLQEKHGSFSSWERAGRGEKYMYIFQ